MTNAQATSCVQGVPAAFATLADQGGYKRTFSFDAHEGERLRPDSALIAPFDTDSNGGLQNWDRDHVQGIVRLPGTNQRFLITRASDDQGPAGLMIADRSEALYFFPTDRSPSNTNHPGGLSIFGSTVAVAVEHGREEYLECAPYMGTAIDACVTRVDDDVGWIDLWTYDESNRARPMKWSKQVSTSSLPGNGNRASSVAYTRTPNGKGLMFLLGRQSGEGWLLQENDYGSFALVQHFPDLYDEHKIADGPYGPISLWSMYQNIHFVTDCDGTLYLMGSAGSEDILPSKRENRVALWRLGAKKRGSFELVFEKAWAPKYDGDRCELRYAGNPAVINGSLTYTCSSGLSSISNGENIGVAEIWAQTNPVVDSTTPIGRPCCEQKLNGSCAYYAPVSGACP